ncbi:MAG: hypothetical protein R3B13_11465 [Polyangiaceae bacterium]
MRHISLGIGLVVFGAFIGCGGSTDGGLNGSGGSAGSAGTSASGGSGDVGGTGAVAATGNVGGTGNVAATGNVSGGGTGNVGNVGGGGTGNVGNVGGGGTGNVAATGNVSGGGTGGCVEVGCGPTGTPCCSPGEGCGTAGGAGPTISCECTAALVWKCSTSGGGGSSGTGGGGGCGGNVACALGTSCCNGKCVNTANDPYNCGGCNNVCAAYPQYCSGGICTKPPCFNGPPPPGTFCCGAQTCQQGQLCCDIQGPGPTAGPTCFTPTPNQKTCPIGCPLCQ